MLEPTKKPPTSKSCVLQFTGPLQQAQAARTAMTALGFPEVRETIPWREAFPERTEARRPGILLHGARTKEGLTQSALAEQTGIPQRHLSEMENGKGAIGKSRAKKLAAVL